LVVVVTPGVSVSFFKPEFDDFLYASVSADKGEMPLSVLSALSRLDVDPWQEAAELSELPPDTATKRLASLLARLPGGCWGQADLRAIADRLIELLPRSGSSNGTETEKTRRLHAMTHSTLAKMLICAALGATALIMAASREPSSRTDHTDVPGSNAATPPQMSTPSSR
jgi:hypothetical protein